MNGTNIIGQGSPGTEAPGSGWFIQGVGDFNGNGDDEILWQNNQTGQTWFMNGANLASAASPGSATPDWSVAPVYTYACSESYGSDVCPIPPAINAVRTNGPFPGGPNVWGPSTGTANPAPSPALSPLTWSPLAAANAQAWAAQCNYGHNPDLNTAGFGENIYAAWGETLSPASGNGVDAVNSWTSEAGGYTYGTSTYDHYTQEVWRGTTAVGCATQVCTENSPGGSMFPDWVFVVCDFAPAGNVGGQTPY
jgi:pathogenesis-related protein 1